MNIKRVVLFAVMLSANAAFADGSCEADVFQKIAKQIFTQAIESEITACKVMPNKPQYSIAAIAYFRAGAAAGEDAYDLDVVVMETGSAKVVKHFSKAQAIAMDGVDLSNLSIDTAKYTVNNKQRAFGVRVQLSNNSRVNPYSETLLDLYVENDKALQQILDRFLIESYGGEWDGSCEGEFSSLNSTLSIKKPEAKGFSDILVRTQSGGSVNSLGPDDCIYKDKPKTVQQSWLKYSNGSYKSVAVKAP